MLEQTGWHAWAVSSTNIGTASAVPLQRGGSSHSLGRTIAVPIGLLSIYSANLWRREQTEATPGCPKCGVWIWQCLDGQTLGTSEVRGTWHMVHEVMKNWTLLNNWAKAVRNLFPSPTDPDPFQFCGWFIYCLSWELGLASLPLWAAFWNSETCSYFEEEMRGNKTVLVYNA